MTWEKRQREIQQKLKAQAKRDAKLLRRQAQGKPRTEPRDQPEMTMGGKNETRKSESFSGE
jgi:hypothetical protein